MENKSGSGSKAGSLGGKGFYIVLFLCAAVIGVSAWILLTDLGTNVEEFETAEAVEVDVSEALVTMLPAGQAMEPVEDVETMTDAVAEDSAERETSEAQAVLSEAAVSYVWPVQGSIQVPYSIQTLMYDNTMADWRTHDGIDIACGLGTEVLAAAGGTVVSVMTDDLLGTTVEIDHANGTHSIYSNLASAPPVTAGQMVTMGQVIGSVGSTALGEVNEVSHLHFAMTKDGLSADPTLYLPSAG